MAGGGSDVVTTIIECCRCKAPIECDRTQLATACGPMRERRPSTDLCPECARAFEAWLAGGPDATDRP